MNWFVDLFREYGLSVLLIVLVLVAIRYVYKRKEKYEKNRFE